MKKQTHISQVYVDRLKSEDVVEIISSTAHMPKDERFTIALLMVLQYLKKMTSSVVAIKRILHFEHTKEHTFLTMLMKSPLDDNVFFNVSIAKGTKYSFDALNAEFAANEYKSVFTIPIKENTTVIDQLPFVCLRTHLREFISEISRGTMGFAIERSNIWRHYNDDSRGIFKAVRDYPETPDSSSFNITIQVVFKPLNEASPEYLMSDEYRAATMN